MKTLLTLLLMLPAAALAQGDHSGGGGDVVYCSTPVGHKNFVKRLFGRKNKTSYYLLDTYEAWKTTGRTLNLGGPNLSVYEKIELIRQDYAQLDPYRANLYADEAIKIAQDLDANEHGIAVWDRIEIVRQWIARTDSARAEQYARSETQKAREKIARFGKSAERETTVWGLATVLDQRLTDIPDADDQFKFLECKKEQLVRQEKPTGVNIAAAFYQFDQKYWRKLDRDNRVATLFHEAIYKEFREYGASVSRPSRLLNAYLFSRSTSDLRLPNYLAFLASNKAKTYHFQSNVGLVRLYNLNEERNLWSARVMPDGQITDVAAAYANLDLSKLGFQWAALPLAQVTSYSFNRARELTALNGVFSISYDPRSKKVIDYKANCLTSAYPCVTGTSITLEEGGKFSLASHTERVTFDLEGNLR